MPTGITLSFVVTILLLVAGHRGSRVTDFLAAGQKTVRGWPVAVAFDRTGALVIADEVGNTVWRVSGAAAR